jgi:hypothetical protein
MDRHYLPIQVVLPRKTDYSKIKTGGGSDYLEEYTIELREKFLSQCRILNENLKKSFQKYPTVPCVGKVIMKEKAIAKSHKPTSLFKDNTCPIVGSEKLDEILVKVTQQGIIHLINTVAQQPGEEVKKTLTKVQEIRPYTFSEKIEIQNFDQLNSIEQPLKKKLFSFDDNTDNEYYIKGFEKLIIEHGLQAKRVNYGKNLCIYKLACKDKEVLNQLIDYPGVHKVSFFPHYASDFPHLINADRQLSNLPMPIQGMDYPIIGIIDSGIAPGHKYLEPWIYKREIFVGDAYRNYEHGTFVAGMIQYGNTLNSNLKQQQHYRILDVVVSPNGDPKKGLTDLLSEYSLIEILYQVIEKYHHEVKVWNMSLGTSKICGNIVSDLAVVLDEIQDLYKIDIILSAGNYIIPPLRKWPPVDDLQDNDRITSPADSVRSISVGSVANIGIDNYVEKDMPSLFSRRGPGANYLIKPDVVFYGGNCTDDLFYRGTGIVSFDVDGNIMEGIGTSYSAPAITSIYAELRYGLTEERTREFSKAFLIHSTTIPESAKKDAIDYNRYYGYGIPLKNIEDIITCTSTCVTLIFSGTLSAGTFIEFNDFPFPKSLFRNGRCYGDIRMTLVYSPKLDASFGQEYCRVNIDAHFGTYDLMDAKGDIKGFKSMVPIEKKWDEKYEKARVENGFKWNPIKSYSRSLKKGIIQKPWRLMIDSVARLGDNYEGQEFVLFVTIKDPENNDIYTEIIQALREHGYHHYDVKITSEIRQTIGL